MKKFLSVLAFALVLSLACVGFTFAEEEVIAVEPAEEAVEVVEVVEDADTLGVALDPVYYHKDKDVKNHATDYATKGAAETMAELANRVIKWPTSTAVGYIRFICVNSEEYDTGIDPKTANDYIDQPILADVHEFAGNAATAKINPADAEDFYKLDQKSPADRRVVTAYQAPDCKTGTDGYITIKCTKHTTDDYIIYFDAEKDTFYGWLGKCNETHTFTLKAEHTWASNSTDPEEKKLAHVKNATCTEKGEITDVCLVCGTEKKLEIEMIGHKWSDEKIPVPGKEPTCQANGVIATVCTVCEAVKPGTEEEVKADAKYHVWQAWVIQKEATCTDDGYKTRSCEKCGTWVSEVIEKTGHAIVEKCTKKVTPATCWTYEKVEYICPQCGKVPSENDTTAEDGTVTYATVDANGNNYTVENTAKGFDPNNHPIEYAEKVLEGGKEVARAATCTKAKAVKYQCGKCKPAETSIFWVETGAPLGHKIETITLKGKCAKNDADALPTLVITYCTRTHKDGSNDVLDDDVAVYDTATLNTYKLSSYDTANRETVAEGATELTADQKKFNEKLDAVLTGEGTKIRIQNIEKTTVAHKWTKWDNRVAYSATTNALWQRYCESCNKVETLTLNNADDPNADDYNKEDEQKNGLNLDADGKFRYYTNGKVDETVTGIVDFQGGSFFVGKGVLCDDANGLNEYPAGTWYFLANGQIQKQYTGLALYDGEWFYIVNGRLDDSLYGLVDFQGGQFLISKGMILSAANGLWQDNDGTWYFLAEGRVASEFTGTTTYQGVTFNVVRGKLAK